MAELTVAVIGCGGAGNVHLGCWANLSGVRIIAVCDLDGVKAARAAMQYEGVAAFTDVRDTLAMQPFDIVDVCTSPDQHFEVASAALRAGANVLCETPLTTTPEDAYALVRLAGERERLLMPAFCHRFHPPLLFARELLENDDLGRLAMFRCRFSGHFVGVAETGLADAARSGGVLMETAIHGLDLFRSFAGEVSSISGKLTTVNPDLEMKDTTALLLQSEGGALGVVEASWSTPGGRSVVEIYGTAGACLVDYDAGTLRYRTADQPVWQHHDESGPNRFEREIAHFADAVRGLQPLAVTGFDGARAVALCAEVYR